jgi:hypothetical protein
MNQSPIEGSSPISSRRPLVSSRPLPRAAPGFPPVSLPCHCKSYLVAHAVSSPSSSSEMRGEGRSIEQLEPHLSLAPRLPPLPSRHHRKRTVHLAPKSSAPPPGHHSTTTTTTTRAGGSLLFRPPCLEPWFGARQAAGGLSDPQSRSPSEARRGACRPANQKPASRRRRGSARAQRRRREASRACTICRPTCSCASMS